MAAPKVKKDMFANIAMANVTMSAANTLTFSQMQMGVGLFQGVAMVIHRILWYPFAAALREIVAATDSLTMAVTTTNRLTAIDDALDPAIVQMRRIIGIAAGIERFDIPFITDLTSLPGGGKLVAANPLWIGATSGGFASAAQIRVQLDFTFIELTDAEYLELIQATYPANIS